jgi:hypothetical protein
MVRLSAATLAETSRQRTLVPLLDALRTLAVVAAATNRTPVVPSVPCKSGWIKREDVRQIGLGSIAGIADDYVLQLPDDDADDAALPVPALRCHLSPGGSDCVEPIVLPGWRRVDGASVTADRAPADGSQILEVDVAGQPREADLDAAAAARLSELRRRCPGYFARDAASVHKGRLA